MNFEMQKVLQLIPIFMPISIINDKNKMLANCLIEIGSTDVLNDVVLFRLQYNYYHLVYGYVPKDQHRRHNLS